MGTNLAALTIGSGLSGTTTTYNGAAANTISIPTSGVTAGSYTNTSLTVNSQGVITAASTGTAPVTSFSAGTTGLTPNTATTGAVTLAGTLAVANGGSGVTTSTGSGSNVLSTSPTLVTPVLGTPASGTLTNCTGLPTTALTGTVTNAQLPDSGVTASTYTSVTVNTKGIVTAGTTVASTNLLPLNNTWTGTNTFNNSLTAAMGTIQITNGVTPPSVGILGGSGDRLILFPGTSSAYPYSLGLNAGTLWYSAPTSSTHNWYVGGNSCMALINTGVSFTTQNASGTNTTISKWRSNNTASEFNFYQQVSAGAYHFLCQAGDFLMCNMDNQNGVSSTAGIVIANWNQTAGLRIGQAAIWMNGVVNTSANFNVTGDIQCNIMNVYGYGRVDNRAMNSKVVSGGLNQFAFGSMANNGSAPFADCIFMNNWVDASGGNTNILMVNKGGYGIRQYQGAFGSSSTMTGYQDACMKATGDDTQTYFTALGGSWGATLVVGSGTDKAGVNTAQVITTNGNLHLDGGNSYSIYYGYYANSRGTPNSHLFFGQDIEFMSDLAQQTNTYAYPVVMCGTRLCRSQAMMRLSYQNNTIGWGGGVNIAYCFYRYNAQVSVKISGKLSFYTGGGGFAYPYIRLYSQNSGAAYYYSLQSYINNTYNHMTFPFELVIYPASVGNTTGWFDVYVYNNGGCITDTGDQLWVNTEILPGSDY